MAGNARDTASSFEKVLRNTIETQPYTAYALRLVSAGYSEECIGRCKTLENVDTKFGKSPEWREVAALSAVRNKPML
jgi:hypothetical protein